MNSGQTLPACSAATLRFIEREAADVIARVEAHLGVTLGAEGRALLVDLCLINETSSAARELRETVKCGDVNCWN
ncbi:MAG: hypothetical protein H7Z38_21540 [Rubrivivax sp.]|nr:hypothetical protein [Pyrinomonadaceae bacterium]